MLAWRRGPRLRRNQNDVLPEGFDIRPRVGSSALVKARHVFLWLLAIVAVLLFVVGGTLLAIAISGRMELAAVQRELAARGEKLRLAELAPPPVPDEENFFADSFWSVRADSGTPLFPDVTETEATDLKQRFPALAEKIRTGGRFAVARDVLPKPEERSPTPDEAGLVVALLEPTQGALDQITRLAKRPNARYPIDYGRGVAMKFPHVTDLLASAQMLMLRGRAEIASGQPAAALADALLIFRLAETVRSEPTLISLLVRMSILSTGFSLIESGLPVWDETQVGEVSQALASADVAAQFLLALRGERGFANAAFSLDKHTLANVTATAESNAIGRGDRRGVPVTTRALILGYTFVFLPGDAAFLNKTYQDWIDGLEKNGGNSTPDATKRFAEIKRDLKATPGASLRHFVSLLALPAIDSAFLRVAFIQCRLDQARTACAIRRFFLARGRHPASLTELVPDFAPSVPLDPIDQQPLRYRTDGNTFTLWSIGWNQTDENGTADIPRKPEQGDWVWKGSAQ